MPKGTISIKKKIYERWEMKRYDMHDFDIHIAFVNLDEDCKL